MVAFHTVLGIGIFTALVMLFPDTFLKICQKVCELILGGEKID